MQQQQQQQRRTEDVVATLGASARTIYAFLVDCLLHVLHLSVNAGMEIPFLMGPLGKGAWHYLRVVEGQTAAATELKKRSQQLEHANTQS